MWLVFDAGDAVVAAEASCGGLAGPSLLSTMCDFVADKMANARWRL